MREGMDIYIDEMVKICERVVEHGRACYIKIDPDGAKLVRDALNEYLESKKPVPTKENSPAALLNQRMGEIEQSIDELLVNQRMSEYDQSNSLATHSSRLDSLNETISRFGHRLASAEGLIRDFMRKLPEETAVLEKDAPESDPARKYDPSSQAAQTAIQALMSGLKYDANDLARICGNEMIANAVICDLFDKGQIMDTGEKSNIGYTIFQKTGSDRCDGCGNMKNYCICADRTKR